MFAAGQYFVGMPAMLGGVDILAELRGTAEMLLDMMDQPAAVQHPTHPARGEGADEDAERERPHDRSRAERHAAHR